MPNKIELESLLSSNDTNRGIIEIDNYICELCSWGEELEKLTEPQKTFYYNQELEREINNGGFNQYFQNSSGSFAHETISSLSLIGAIKTAGILQTAINQFPNGTVPKDQIERQNVLTIIEGIANETWEEPDQKFFIYEDDLNFLNIEYIKQNKNSFVQL